MVHISQQVILHAIKWRVSGLDTESSLVVKTGGLETEAVGIESLWSATEDLATLRLH